MTTVELYQQRLARYVTAMRNEKPDRVPLRPFVAEFTARYAGYTCQQVAHDYRLAFDAARRCARDFDWDAIVPNMVAAWTGMAQAAGLRYYGIPGLGIPAGHLPSLAREGRGTARDHRRPRPCPRDLGRDRGFGQHLHLATPARLLRLV